MYGSRDQIHNQKKEEQRKIGSQQHQLLLVSAQQVAFMFRLYTVKPVKNKERKNLGCPSA